MLTLFTNPSARDCSGVSRRDFIRIGAMGLGGFSLPGMLASKAATAASERDFLKDKSVVLLFLAGGASHIETFDPHIDAPQEIRSVTGEVATTIAGVTFGGTFPRLAKLARKMAVVRSFRHTITDHPKAIQHVLTAGHPAQVSMGSIYTRFRGTNHAATGLPAYMTLLAPEIDPQYLKEKDRV